MHIIYKINFTYYYYLSERMGTTHFGAASDQSARHGRLPVHRHEFGATVGQQTDKSQRGL